ncbi:hypothetical protein SAMN05421543_1389 [Alicyclobacillus macrosporangiidus]|uniref:Uncharacterized protein n=1 Tax=Alicyclobacillus macrosporangiidus TaxID=392015 RepID=A0A1I7LDG4_9BACL|nr:hypothetical protein SAMN05421543_1389 [Alicyclobacillus macrosporangiidus]
MAEDQRGETKRLPLCRACGACGQLEELSSKFTGWAFDSTGQPVGQWDQQAFLGIFLLVPADHSVLLYKACYPGSTTYVLTAGCASVTDEV